MDNAGLAARQAQQPHPEPVDYGIPLESYGDIEHLRRIVEALYIILDDIDTMDDAAKENEAFYRRAVSRLHQKKATYICSDGYKLFVKRA